MVPAQKAPQLPTPVREALRIVKQAIDEEYNILVTPAQLQRCPAMFTPAVTTVGVPSLDLKLKWVYKIPGGGELGLSKPMLLKLAAASGVTFVPEKSGRLDDCSSPHHCRFRVVGRMTMFDGTVREMTGSKEMDLRDESPLVHNMHRAAQKTEDYYAKQDNRKPKEVDAWDRVWQTREHMESHAETKAMLRVVRALLGVKTSYSAAELKKPFLVMKMVFSPPADDPQINRMIAAQQLGMTDALYGPGSNAGEQLTRPGLLSPGDTDDSDPAVDNAGEAEPDPNEDHDLVDSPAEQERPAGKTIDVSPMPDGRPEPPPREQEFPPAATSAPKPGTKAPAKAPPKAAVLRCECGCGCGAEVTGQQAKATAKEYGIRLCAACDPRSNDYDYARHQEKGE